MYHLGLLGLLLVSLLSARFAVWNQNLLHPNLGEHFKCGTATNMQAVHSELLCLSSLFLKSSRFPFVICPVSDISAHPSGRKDSRETCEVTSSSCFCLHYPLSLTSILSAVGLIVIQHSIKTSCCCFSSFTNCTSYL